MKKIALSLSYGCQRVTASIHPSIFWDTLATFNWCPESCLSYLNDRQIIAIIDFLQSAENTIKTTFQAEDHVESLISASIKTIRKTFIPERLEIIKCGPTVVQAGKIGF